MTVTLTYSGTTVTVHETADIVKAKLERYSRKFIPGGGKLTLEKLGSEGCEIKITGLLTGSGKFTDKNTLQSWHENAYTVTYSDIEGNIAVKITELYWTLLRGTPDAVQVSLTLNEA